LLLVARDPHWLYVHWDLSDTELRACNQRSARGHLAVRIHTESLDGPPLIEQEVHPESRSWFLHVPRPMASYVAELGFHNRQGEWERVAISSVTRTPPAEPSAEREARFASLPIHLPLSQLIRRPGNDDRPAAERRSEAASTDARSPDPQQQGHRPDSSPPQGPSAIGRSHENGPWTAWADPRPDFPSWTSAHEQALARLIHRKPASAATTMTSPQWGGWPGGEPGQPVREAGPPQPGPWMSSIMEELPPSSPFGAPVAISRSFWFKVNAELILYGATDPMATVEVGDRRIRLRADGSFSFRFSLPDGIHSLFIRATAPEAAETRSAQLRFERASEYCGDVPPHPQMNASARPAPNPSPRLGCSWSCRGSWWPVRLETSCAPSAPDPAPCRLLFLSCSMRICRLSVIPSMSVSLRSRGSTKP
jgi:hypothetical protein